MTSWKDRMAAMQNSQSETFALAFRRFPMPGTHGQNPVAALAFPHDFECQPVTSNQTTGPSPVPKPASTSHLPGLSATKAVRIVLPSGTMTLSRQ